MSSCWAWDSATQYHFHVFLQWTGTITVTFLDVGIGHLAEVIYARIRDARVHLSLPVQSMCHGRKSCRGPAHTSAAVLTNSVGQHVHTNYLELFCKRYLSSSQVLNNSFKFLLSLRIHGCVLDILVHSAVLLYALIPFSPAFAIDKSLWHIPSWEWDVILFSVSLFLTFWHSKSIQTDVLYFVFLEPDIFPWGLFFRDGVRYQAVVTW